MVVEGAKRSGNENYSILKKKTLKKIICELLMAGYFLSSLVPYFLKYKDRMFQMELSCQDDGRFVVQTENLKCFPFSGFGKMVFTDSICVAMTP